MRRSRAATGIRRGVVLFAAVGMIGGVGLLTAGFAMAAGVGSEPGNLALNPSGGSLSTTPTWSTTDACPTGNNASAQLAEFKSTGARVNVISPAVGTVTSAFNGTLDGNVGALMNSGGVSPSHPGTLEWSIGCWNGTGGTGTGSTPVKYVQSVFVTVSANGTYATSGSSTATPTSTPTSTPTATPTPTASPTPTSTLPSGGAGTGAGGASLPGGGSSVLISLGALALAGAAAAIGVAIRRPRKLTEQIGQGDGDATPPGTV